jgi:hypothetical protein
MTAGDPPVEPDVDEVGREQLLEGAGISREQRPRPGSLEFEDDRIGPLPRRAAAGGRRQVAFILLEPGRPGVPKNCWRCSG